MNVNYTNGPFSADASGAGDPELLAAQRESKELQRALVFLVSEMNQVGEASGPRRFEFEKRREDLRGKLRRLREEIDARLDSSGPLRP
jgi:hypothetical protein